MIYLAKDGLSEISKEWRNKYRYHLINSCAFVMYDKNLYKCNRRIYIGKGYKKYHNNWRRIKSYKHKFKCRRIEDKISLIITHEFIHLLLDDMEGIKTCVDFDKVDSKYSISEWGLL